MSDKPLVSVVINCLNGASYLREAVDSVYAQTFSDYEIIVWDNASTDNTGEIAQSYNHALRYFRGEKTIPLGAARNLALRQCQGEYFAFLDCDDIWEPRHLERLLEAFTDDRIGLTYTDVLNVRNDREHPICRLSEKLKPASGDVFFDMVGGVYVNPSMAMVRRSVLDDVGCFDESYDFVEEAELFLRIARKYRFGYINEPLTVYRYHEGNFSNRFVSQQAETLRFRAELLERYPDIRQRLPHLEQEWMFNFHARNLRWYVASRDYVRATSALLSVTWQGVRTPGYAWARLKAYLNRLTGKTPTADWLG